jgi:hypothetical protein
MQIWEKRKRLSIPKASQNTFNGKRFFLGVDNKNFKI